MSSILQLPTVSTGGILDETAFDFMRMYFFFDKSADVEIKLDYIAFDKAGKSFSEDGLALYFVKPIFR